MSRTVQVKGVRGRSQMCDNLGEGGSRHDELDFLLSVSVF